MEILIMAMEFFIGFVFLTVTVACCWGGILFVMDEQADYEERQKSIKNGKENDTSRERNT